MSRKVQAPEIERPEDDPLADSIERHPAFAMIGASRFSSTGMYLYGSDFKHHDGVTITICGSELHRGLSRDWHAGREEYIEVTLSEAQWASFVSRLNIGDGIPCTLEFLAGKTEVPGIAEPIVSRKEQFAGEMGERLARIDEVVKRMKAMEESGKLSKRELRDLRITLENMKGNVQFVADQFGEHMETTTERVKIEVGAYIANAVQRTGLAALKGQPISLPEDKPKEKQ